MAYDPHDTIAAIATADGGSARGMVRISGPATHHVLAALRKREASQPPNLPTAFSDCIEVTLGGKARSLPCDVFLWPTSRSYTREPVAEIHTLGSPPLLRALLDAVCRAGARLAEPGEFTLRAFLAGRLDLTQAEAVLGVIDAQGSSELEVAAQQLSGNLARPLHRVRDDLLALLAELEAGLDFVEEDIEFISAADLTQRLQITAEQISEVAAQVASRETAAAARQVVLAGPPNAGKSSLFNGLVHRFGGREQSAAPAIVSAIRGTTRDYLTARVEIGGCACELIDTAGIETDQIAPEMVTAAAQQLSTERREQSLLQLWCKDASLSTANDSVGAPATVDVIVLTKSDLTSTTEFAGERVPLVPVVATSSVTGAGLDELATTIARLLARDSTGSRAGCIASTADRCRDSVRLAAAAIDQALAVAGRQGGDELIAAEIRVALAELGKVVGAVYTDDLLDRIFKTFCIGK